MGKSELEFRFAEAHDHAALAGLLLEANHHYWGEREEAGEMTFKAATALVNGSSGCRAVLAWHAGIPKGFATIAILHPALNEHGTLFMKDLFISNQARGTGIGNRFMRHLAQVAVALGCRRFDWTAETDNPRAIAFYDELGAARVVEKVYFRLSENRLHEFSSVGDD